MHYTLYTMHVISWKNNYWWKRYNSSFCPCSYISSDGSIMVLCSKVLFPIMIFLDTVDVRNIQTLRRRLAWHLALPSTLNNVRVTISFLCPSTVNPGKKRTTGGTLGVRRGDEIVQGFEYCTMAANIKLADKNKKYHVLVQVSSSWAAHVASNVKIKTRVPRLYVHQSENLFETCHEYHAHIV